MHGVSGVSLSVFIYLLVLLCLYALRVPINLILSMASDITMAINNDIIMVADVSIMRLIIAYWWLIVATVMTDRPNSIMVSNKSIMVAVFKAY